MKDSVVQESGVNQRERTIVQSKSLSKEDYIAKLEAELRVLKEGFNRGFSLEVLVRTHSVGHAREDYRQGSVRDVSRTICINKEQSVHSVTSHLFMWKNK